MQNLLRQMNLKNRDISLHLEFAYRKLVKLMRKSARLQHHSCEIQDIGSSNPRVIGIIKFYRIDAIVGIRLSISDMWVSFKIRDRNIVPLLHHNRIRDNT